MIKRVFILLFAIISFGVETTAQKWSFSFHPGTAYNVPLPLTIMQDGHPDIRLAEARFDTEPFTLPIYWDWRITRLYNHRSWNFEAVHHKLYLRNLPDEVQRFHISHGFNILAISRGVFYDHFHIRYGLGIVLTHPESEVRNLKLDENLGILGTGYYISGSSLNFALGKRIYLLNRLYVNAEGKATYSFVNVPINSGRASLSNLALHAIVGIGFDFISKD
jgi:hypothetical protein